MAKSKISSQDRDFFTLLAQAVNVNPFSRQRDRLYRRISGADAAPATMDEMIEAIIQQLDSRLARLDKTRPATLTVFDDADRDLMHYVFLFDTYHRFIHNFDDLTKKQAQESKPLPVPFAAKVLNRLLTRGFSAQQSERYFALYYQLRRAFYLIEHALIGRSECMRQLRMNLWNNIFTHDIRHYEKFLWNRMEDFSTLLLGPTGCGKGAAAAAIGRCGCIPYDPQKKCFADSFTNTFVPINLSQFAETLLESELFGHAKGAFTGAIQKHQGLLARCSPHGAVFLDEIGEITEPIQIKLLQVLEERQFSPVGSFEKNRFQGRIIAATNRSLDQLREQGRFRDDFFYRLCSDIIQVPSLHQRIAQSPEELDDLIAHTVTHITGRKSPELEDMAVTIIREKLGPDYPWPGNVRELAQCVRRILIKRDYQPDHCRESQNHRDRFFHDIETSTHDAASLLSGYCRLLYERLGSYQAVARQTGLDRRTVKKHLEASE